MDFNYWFKVGQEARLYVAPNTPGKAFISLLKSGHPRVNSLNTHDKHQVQLSLSQGTLMNSVYASMEDFMTALQNHNHNIVNRAPKQPVKKPASDFINVNTPTHLHKMALDIDPASIKFLRGKSHYTITVDTREPEGLFPLFQSSGIRTELGTLSVGDIRITHRDTGDELIFERKTCTDLYASIVSNHAHRQAESLYDYQAKKAEQGHRVQIIWLVEGQDEGTRLLYNAFPEVKQTDGVINYFAGILGQGVLQTYNINHTVCLAIRLIQGFFERELVYKVNEKTRKATSGPVLQNASNYHGVRGDNHTLLKVLMAIPSLKEPVAHQIIERGHTLSDVLKYSQSDWLALEGVGKVLSERLIKEIQAIQ